ncbi:unnamed protein product [Eruca vesicaria subsp. sativa]|uniref:SHSP domain-containing protein n=1 Tax=Eruca vesicaria subsp. sativa TaxID=29727 RepID=A0ABC8IR91_ERUVS|nr:unnamed protein product [Eruca vesicaria subsp. sativa]
MELELGLKIIRTKEDVSSSTDYKVARDALCQVSPSKETDSAFILTLHLKGFKKKGVDVEINEEGDRITINGRKEVEEMVLVKWVEWKKETEIQEFKKVFKIPNIVNLDKIKARFSDEDETLTVTFPKKFKGMTGLKIEEEEEEEEEEETELEDEKAEEITEPEEEKTEEIAEPEEEIKEETIPEEEAEEEPKMEEEEGIVEEEETRDHEEEVEEKEMEQSTNQNSQRQIQHTRKELVMELELGLKVTRTTEDVSSSVDFRFSKDPFGPLVLSQETDSRFIIIIHLKGFKKEGIEIDINKEGDRITIRGRKPVEEMVMIRWMAWRKEVEMRAFKKVFLIPDFVDLDKIKARFDDDDATLTITMPKRVKGISGFNLEQEEEEEEESVDFGDVSEVENREDVEEENVEREESDEQSETQGEEGFGEMMEDKERESQVFEGEEEAKIEDDDLEKIPQIDEQDKVFEFDEEEAVGQQELADSDIESEDSGLEKLLDIKEEIKSEDTGSGAVQETEEQQSDEDSGLKNLLDIIEQEDKQAVMEEKVSEEAKSDDLKSEATEEIEEQASDEDSGLKNLPGMIEKEDSQEVIEQKVSEDTNSDDTGPGAVQEIEKQESDDESGLKNLEDIIEQEDNQEVMEHKVSEEIKSFDTGSEAVKETEEQESDDDSGLKNLRDIIEQEVIDQKVSEEAKSNDIGSGAVEETEKQETDEVVGTSKKSREMKNKKTDGGDDDNDGLRKAQRIKEPERYNKESKIQEMVEEETCGQEKIKNKDSKGEFDGKEAQTEDEDLEKRQQTDEEGKVSQHEIADSVTESEDSSSLRKPTDILEQDVKKQNDSQAETRSDGFGSGAFEEIQKQEPRENDDGLRKAQGIREAKRRNEVRKNQEMVEGETSDPEKRKNVKMETKRKDPKEDVDAEIGEGSTPNTERTQVVSETETKLEEHESEKPEADEVDKKHEFAEKKAEENTKVRRESEDRRSLVKLKENKEQHSKGQKQQDKHESIKEVVEEEAPEAETNIENDVQKQVQESEASEVDTIVKTYDEGKDKKKSMNMETAPNIAETETKPEDFESEKQGADKVDRRHKLVEKKQEEDANVKAKCEDISLLKFQEDEEQHSKGRKRQDKQENIKELVEEKTQEAEKNIGNDVPRPAKETEPEEGASGKVMEQKVSEETKSDNIGSGAVEEMEEKITGGQEKSAKEESKGKETQTEDEIGKILESAEEKNVDQQEFADSVTDSRSLRKPPDILEQENNQEVMEQKDSQEETRSDGFGCRDSEEIEKQEPCEQLDGASKSREKADDDGLSKVQGSEEPERRNAVRKIQEMVEGGTSDHEKRKIVKMETKNKDPKEDVDADIGKGSQVVAETETKAEELEYIKPEADEEDEDTKVRRESEDRRSLVKLKENEEQQDKEENIKELVKEKAPEAETSIENDVAKPVQETEASEIENEGKEKKKKKKKKNVEMETAPKIAENETKPEDEVDNIHKLVEKKDEEDANVRAKGEDNILTKLQENEEPHSQGRKGQDTHDDVKEFVEEKIPEAETDMINDVPKPVQKIEVPEAGTLGETGDQGKKNKSAAKIVVTETKPEDFESDKVEGDEVEKIHKLVEKKEEEDENNAEVGTQSEYISSIKPQEAGEQLSQGQKRHEKIKELVEEETEEAETNIKNDTPKPVQEETKDAESRKPQETIRQQNLDECERSKQESKTQELVKSKTNDIEKEEKEIQETVTKEQESCRPKVLGEEEEKFKELDEEKPHFSKNRKSKDEEDILEKKTELGDDNDISRKAGDSDPKEKVDAEMGKGFAPSIAETETKPEDFESEKPVEKKEEEDANVRRKSEDKSLIKLHENEEQHSEGRKRQDKQESLKELVEEKAPEEETNVMNDVQTPVHQELEPEVRTNTGETETKPDEFVSDQLESYKVGEIHELVEKKKEVEDEKNAEVGTESEEGIISLLKPQEIGEQQQSQQHYNQGKIEELEEEKTPEAETNRETDTLKPVQVDTPNISETETKPEDIESEKQGADEVDKMHKLVEKKEEEDANARSKSEDSILTKLQEDEEQEKQENIKELVEEKTPEAERSMANDVLKPVQEIEVPNIAVAETKTEEFESDKVEPDEVEKIHKLVEKKEDEDEKNGKARTQSEDISSIKPQGVGEQQSQGQKPHDKHEKIRELVEEKTIVNDTPKPVHEETNHAESRKPQKTSRQQELDECERSEQESKTQELVKSKTNDEEKEEKYIEETVTEEQDSYRPKEIGEEEEKVQELAEEKPHFSKNRNLKREEKVPEKKIELGDDDCSRKAGDSGAREELDAEMGKGFASNTAETEKKPEVSESEKLGAVELEKIQKPVEKKNEKAACVRRKSEDRSLIKLQENEEQHSEGRKRQDKQESIKELVEEKAPEEDQDLEPELGTLGETGGKEKKKSESLDAKEELDVKLGVPNTGETEKKPDEFVSDKIESDKVEEMHELVEKKKEVEDEKNAEVGTESEEGIISLLKPQEIEEKTPEAETNRETDTLKPVQERGEEKQKIPKLSQEERKEQPQEHKEKMVETGNKIDDAGSRKVQEIITQHDLETDTPTPVQEPDLDMLGKTGNDGKEKKKSVAMEIKNGQGVAANIAETETKHEELDKLESEEVEELVEKKEEDNAKKRGQSKDSIRQQDLDEVERCEKESKIQEVVKGKTNDEEKEEKGFSKNRKIKEEEKNPEKKTELGDDDDISRKDGDSDAKEEVDAEMGRGFAQSIAETDKVDKIHEMVEKKEEEDDKNAKVGTQSEDISLIKPQEVREQEKIEDLVEEKTPEAETNIGNDTLKPVQETGEGIQKKQREEHKEKMVDDAGSKKGQEIIRKQDLDEAERCKESKTKESVKSKTKDEEKGIEQTETKEQVSYKPKILWDEETAEKKIDFDEVLRRVGDAEERDSDSKEEVDAEMEKGFKPNIAETETKGEEFDFQKMEPDENDDVHEVVEEKNAKVREQSEDRSLIKLQENERQHSKRQKRQDKTAETEINIPTPVGVTGQRDSDAKEEFDPEIGKGSTPNISETEKKADTVKPVEEDMINEQVEKKKKKEENDKVRRQSEDTGLKRLQEQKSQGPNGQNKQENTNELVEEKPVLKGKRPEVSTLETYQEKVFAETETKDQESYRPKILEGEDTIQELAEEKIDVSRKVEEEEETAENNTELSDDDMSRKGSDAMKGQEENEEFQELAQEEQISDGGKKIVGEAISENGRQRKVQEIDEHRPHEEDKHGNQFQKLIGGETSGQGENEDVESEKKTTEADKRFRESQEIERTDSDVKYGKGEMFQELQKEEKEDEADIPARGTGTIQQELVNLKSQMEQETGEETQELLDERINHCKEEEESETKTDDVIRMLEDTKEQELLEPTRNHVSKIEEVIEEKIAEPEIEDEYGGLRKVHGTEEHESYERYKSNITGTEEPSGQEKEVKEKVLEFRTVTEKEKSPNSQEIKDQRPDKESHEKPYKIQELVGAKDNDHHDGFKRPVVQDKKQETEKKEMNRELKEGDTVERRTKPEDVSFRKGQDDEDPEMSKPYMPQEEDKIQEPVEMGTSDYKETVKKQDGNDTLRSKESGKPNLDELERHSEQKKIYQGEDKIQEPVKMRTHDYSEKAKKQDGDVEEEGNVEDGSSEQLQEIEERKSHEDWSDEMQEKRKDFCKEEATDPKESEEKNKTRAVEEEKEIVERRTKNRDGSLRNVQDDAEPEPSTPYKPQEEDKVYESVETGTSGYREKVKKQDGTDTLRRKSPKDKHTAESDHYDHEEEQEEEKVIAKTELKAEEDTTGKIQETEKQKPDELQRSLVQENMQETEEKEEITAMEESEILERRTETEDGSLREVGDGKEAESSKPYKRRDENKIQELEKMETSEYREKFKTQDGDDVLRSQETEKLDLVKEEATGPKDEQGESEEERYEKVAHTETKVEDEINKEVEEIQKEEQDSLDDPMTKIKESEKEELHEPEIHEKLHIVQDFVEEETVDQVDDEDSSRILQTMKEHEDGKEQRNIPKIHDPKVNGEDEERIVEKEAHVQELEGKTEKFKDYNEERREQETKRGKTVETKSDYVNVNKRGETKVQESDEKKNQEPGEKIEELERKEASNHGVKLVTEEDSLTEGQEFIENESSKRRPMGQENIQQLKDAENEEDEGKSDAGVEMQAKINEEKGIKASEKVAEVDMQANIGIRVKDQETKRQEPYELLKNEEHDKIPEPTLEGTKHEREGDREVEEMKRKYEDVSSREVQKIKAEEEDGLEKHKKLSGFQEELNEAGGYNEVLERKSMEDSSQSQDVEEKRSDQTERYAEQEELVAEVEEEKEQNEKAKRMPQVESKANDDISEKNETQRLRGQKKNKDSQPVAKTETSDKRKEEREEKIVGEAVTRDECDSSRKNQEHEEEQSDKLGRLGEEESDKLGKHGEEEEEEMSGSLAIEETSKDKGENRRNRAGADTTSKDDGFREEQLAIVLRHEEQDKKQLVSEKNTSKAKDKRNQETKSRDESSRRTRENEKQESHEQKRNYEEQDKSLVEEKINNQEKEDKKSMFLEISEDHESKEPERMRKQDKGSELVQQRSTDNLQDEETKISDKESSKTHQLIETVTGAEERRKEQGRIKQSEEDTTHSCKETECEEGSSKKIQEIDKEESDEPRKDVERDKNQPVDSETSEDDSEELEVEVEDSEEDWEAEVIQEMDSDDDNDKHRKIRRIKLGFRLVGGSTLFMSLIVIVFRLIHSKRKIKCYKF